MSFTEKIDVLDLLINILKEHEEKLDQLVERLEKAADALVPSNPLAYEDRLKQAFEKAYTKKPVDDTARHQLTAYLHAENEQRNLKEYLDERRR